MIVALIEYSLSICNMLDVRSSERHINITTHPLNWVDAFCFILFVLAWWLLGCLQGQSNIVTGVGWPGLTGLWL